MSEEQVKVREPVKITTAYILGNGTIVDAEALLSTDVLRGKLVPKMKGEVAASTTSQFSSVASPGSASGTRQSWDDKVVEPPYDPVLLAKFLEVDEICYRCVRTKVTDSVCRGFQVKRLDEDEQIDNKIIVDETELINGFIESCNRFDKFRGVFEQAAMDHESVGWGAVEIIRSMDKRIRKLNHIPASRIRVIEGWEGFVEIRNDGSKVFYQPFGSKVVSLSRKDANGVSEPFDIKEDLDWGNSEWYLRDRTTFEPTNSLEDAANELIFVPKVHPKSVYYGLMAP